MMITRAVMIVMILIGCCNFSLIDASNAVFTPVALQASAHEQYLQMRRVRARGRIFANIRRAFAGIFTQRRRAPVAPLPQVVIPPLVFQLQSQRQNTPSEDHTDALSVAVVRPFTRSRSSSSDSSS